MAALTFYLLDTLAANSSHLALQDGGTPPATVTSTTGWTVGNQAAGQSSSMAARVERARATFTATEQPAGPPSGILGDCFRIPARLTGDFAAGNFILALPLIAVTSGGDQDVAARLRLWRSRFPDGALAHEITASIQTGTTITNLATAAQQISTVTAALAAFALAREFLFFQLALGIIGAGGAISRDALIRNGIDAKIVTPDLAPTTYQLWLADQLDDDEIEWASDYDTERGSFLTTNAALTSDPANATLRQAYADQQAAMDTRKLQLLRIEAERKRREGESAADIGSP